MWQRMTCAHVCQVGACASHSDSMISAACWQADTDSRLGVGNWVLVQVTQENGSPLELDS